MPAKPPHFLLVVAGFAGNHQQKKKTLGHRPKGTRLPKPFHHVSPNYYENTLTFGPELGKLGIAPHHPIGYNDGRFDGIAALIRDGGGQAKGQRPPGTGLPIHAMNRASAPC